MSENYFYIHECIIVFLGMTHYGISFSDAFTDEQLYIVFLFEDGGQDLEGFKVSSLCIQGNLNQSFIHDSRNATSNKKTFLQDNLEILILK